jgi:bidirectional [NiFe] hydrogenase diaphorase subunit
VKEIVIRIDGQEVHASVGKTILEVAKEKGIFIPTLCHLDGLSDIGACRMCIVDVGGKIVTSCTTEIANGMEITTQSERLTKLRRMNLELIFAERNHVCSFCVSNGHCELQDLACDLGMDSVRVPYAYPRLSLDASHPRFIVDHNRCILCGRCVRVCAEVEGAHTWGIGARGRDARVITDLAIDWGEAETCTSCGKCVQVCPTGAIIEKGKATAEMVKRPELVAELTERRGHDQG